MALEEYQAFGDEGYVRRWLETLQRVRRQSLLVSQPAKRDVRMERPAVDRESQGKAGPLDGIL
jgi:hypothetical protein